jgi:flagellar biosynthetic protein FliO
MQSTIWSVLMLIAVVGSIPLALWTLKRLQLVRPSGQRQLGMLSQMSVGHRERVAIVQIRDRQIVIGITAHQVTLLVELDPECVDLTEKPLEDPKPRSMGAAFAQALANTRAGLSNEK